MRLLWSLDMGTVAPPGGREAMKRWQTHAEMAAFKLRKAAEWSKGTRRERLFELEAAVREIILEEGQ